MSSFNIAKACLDPEIWKRSGLPPLTFVDATMRPQSFGFGELGARVEAIAKGLQSIGIKRGDRVLLRFPNTPDFPASFFGVMRMGAIAVPLSRYLTTAEMEIVAHDVGAAWGLTSAEWIESFPRSVTALDPLKIEAKAKFFREKLSDHPTDAEDPAYLVATSGTTATPKGVLHAHRVLIGREPATRYWLGLEIGDVVLHSGDVNWTYTLGTGLMDPWRLGIPTIMYEGKKSPQVWVDLIKALKPTIFISVPAVLRQILDQTAATREDFASLKRVISAGEHLPISIYEAWQQRFGVELYDGLGLSECSYFVSNQVGMKVKPGSCGKAQPGRRVVILDDAGHPINGAGEGRLAVDRSDAALMLGYWPLPSTKSPSLEGRGQGEGDRWFITGDCCARDADGYFWYQGRDDDIVNALGYRISPVEVEQVINACDGVVESAVVGISHGAAKILLTAFVVADRSKIFAENLLAHCTVRLARYKVPKEIRFVDSLPRTANGKLQRKILTS